MALRVERIGMVIDSSTDPSIGSNIQGPSVIRTPPWIADALGTYLMYFADHKGDHIRLAFADDVAGPWTVVPGGCLSLADSKFLVDAPSAGSDEVDEIVALYDELYDGYESVDMIADLTAPHIASPDVRVDEQNQTIEMWFHGLESLGWQVTRHATSADGQEFSVGEPVFDGTYLRTFRHEGEQYGLAMPGRLLKRTGGPTEFEVGPTLLPPTSRHMAAWVDGEVVRVLYTNVGDAPERIMMVEIDTSADWSEWTSSGPVELLRPQEPWEGAELLLVPSIRSFWPEPANQLRDPYVFIDEDAGTYLFYAVAGECGIAVARIVEH